MKDTCNKECFLWKEHGDNCPNYVVGYFKKIGEHEEKRVEDCVPKRTLLQLQELNNLIIGLQQTSNEERNANNGLAYALFKTIEFAGSHAGKIEVKFPDAEEKMELPAGQAGD